jgi:hypothetical protein
VVVLVLPAPSFGQTPGGETPNSPLPIDRFEQFVDIAVQSPVPYVYAAGGALIDQASGFPEEWTGVEGFEKRNAARWGQGLAADAIGHAAAAVLHHRVRYDSCECHGAVPRTAHGVLRAFVSARDDGGRAPNYSLWIAKFAAAGMANAWYPDSYTRRDVFWQALTSIGVSAGLNVVQEFAPELLRLVHRK